MSDTSLLFNFLKGRDTASSHMKKVADSSTSMASKIKVSSIVSVASTATMIAGFATLAAQAVALVNAVAPVVGIAALLPAVMIAAAGGVGVLMMATRGLAEAMKKSTGGAASNGQALVAAERRVQSAQQASLQAQVALNAARLTAADRLKELSHLLRRAALDERGGVLAVTDATIALREARKSGDGLAVSHAQLGYDEAVMSLEEIRARTTVLAAEEKKRTAAGINGSDEVLTAMRHQADALQNLADAQAALKTAGAGSGGVDKAAEAYGKLSKAGKQLVDVLKVVAPAWGSVQRTVQQSVFAGVAGDIRRLSTVYLPVMRQQLPAIGKGWNSAFRGTAQLAASTGFVKDMNVTLGNTADMWQRIGSSFAPFLNGFQQFAVVGSAFLPGVGSWIQRGADAFSKWATAARESGKAHDWIANALTVLSQVWEIAKNLGSSILSIFRAGDAGPGWLPGLVAGTKALSDFLASPAGQGKLAEVFGILREVGTALWLVITQLGPALLNLAPAAGGTLTDTFSVAGVVVGFLADHLDLLGKALPVLAAGFLVVKSAQVLGTITAVADVPVRLLQSIAMWRHTAALRANTSAMATNSGTQKKGLVAMIASKVAMVASTLWTGIVTAAQWLWNIAMMANPIGLIILAVVLLVAGIVLLWQNSAGFRDFFIGLWDHIWSFLKMVGRWFVEDFTGFFVDGWHWLVNAGVVAFLWIRNKIDDVVKFVTGLGGKIGSAAKGMWDGLVDGLRAAVNVMIRLWNAIDFGIHLRVPDWVPFIGGRSFDVDDVIPDLPYLAKGGMVDTAGLAVVGDRGPEIVSLNRGASVHPLPAGGSGGGGSYELGSDGSREGDALIWAIRRAVRGKGGDPSVLGLRMARSGA